jgi:TfoX/Sxy family transcriptional regulator of competence genes
MDLDFIHDLFAPFGPVTVRRMFSAPEFLPTA